MLQRTMWVLAAAALTAWVAQGLAADAPAGVEYTFDTKDDLQGWKPNDPTKAQWQEGGANKSAGCLKLTGGHASVDSPRFKVKAEDCILSLDYFVHGIDAIRVRGDLTTADEKYGKVGQTVLRKIKQDQWVHFEIKLTDLPSTKDKDAKASPDMVFQKLIIAAMTEIDADSYLLLDNIKIAKPAAPATQPGNP